MPAALLCKYSMIVTLYFILDYFLKEYVVYISDLKQNSEPRILMGNVVDIEDLVGYGQKNK